MKVTKKFLIGLMLLTPVFCVAQSDGKPSQGILTRLEKIKVPKKHRAPSHVFIECIYTGNGFNFLPNDIFESLSVTVTNVVSSEIWSADISDSNGYVLETGPLPAGIYMISALTENDSEFYGEFELTQP